MNGIVDSPITKALCNWNKEMNFEERFSVVHE